MEHYKECLKYQDKLGEYAAKAYLTCLNNVTYAMTKKGFEVVVLALTEMRMSLVP